MKKVGLRFSLNARPTGSADNLDARFCHRRIRDDSKAFVLESGKTELPSTDMRTIVDGEGLRKTRSRVLDLLKL